MRTSRTIGTGLLLLGFALAEAGAQEIGGVNPVELFQQLDSNGDLVIEAGEVPDSGRPAFQQLLKDGDTNKDGKIDREEYRSLIQGLRGPGGGFGGFGNGAGNGAERFKAMDKNGDGKISRAEFQGPPMFFDRVDKDGDGAITREEIMAFRGAAQAGMGRFKAMDTDGDGKVSKKEFQGPEPLFARLDTDQDGFLTLAEAARFGAAGGGANAGANAPRFRALDKNGDGKLSRDEFPGRGPGFDRLDTNKDGSLSIEELQAIRDLMPAAKAKGASKSASKTKKSRS